jgi:hypothetical protein
MMFNKAKVNALTADLRTTLEALAQRHGIGVAVGVAHFNTESVRVKVEFSAADEGGVVITPSGRQFKHYAQGEGLEPDDLGRAFTWKGREYTIAGFNPRKAKFPVEVRRDDGVMFGVTSQVVRRSLGRSNPPAPKMDVVGNLLQRAEHS